MSVSYYKARIDGSCTNNNSRTEPRTMGIGVILSAFNEKGKRIKDAQQSNKSETPIFLTVGNCARITVPRCMPCCMCYPFHSSIGSSQSLTHSFLLVGSAVTNAIQTQTYGLRLITEQNSLREKESHSIFVRSEGAVTPKLIGWLAMPAGPKCFI